MSASKWDTSLTSPDSSGLLYEEQPICALSSAPGPGAIAVLRASGTGVLPLMAKLLPELSEKKWAEPRILHRANVRDAVSNVVIDDVMMVHFRGPASYTGQDMVELFCHGGPYIVQKILGLMQGVGFRLADPGEFTQRAFLNGKLDLAQAEGIKVLVGAESEQQWKAAQGLVDQRLSKHVIAVRAALVHAMAHLEALIDFPDEGDTKSAALATVDAQVKTVQKQLAQLAASYQSGRVATEGLRISIIGPPNAGKSTLLNTLLRQERAIVTAVAGTTRDYLQERCLIKGRLVTLLDTAGIREATDTIERMGVEKAEALAESADLVLSLRGADQTAVDARLQALLAGIAPAKVLAVTTMRDKVPASSVQAAGDLAISCHTGEGMDELENAICARIDSFVGNLENQAYIATARQLDAIVKAEAGIVRYFEGRAVEAFEEMLAFELQETARELMSIVGRIDNEDILDKVFSDFCVGK